MIDVCQILRQFDDDDSAVTLSNYKIFSFQSFHAEVHQYKSRIEEFNNLTQVRSQKKIRKRMFHPWMIIYQEDRVTKTCRPCRPVGAIFSVRC